MESGNPRQMRGASELLCECVDDVKEHLLSAGINEEHIIISGATLSALVPHGRGGEFVFKAEEIFRKKCRTASAAFVFESFMEGGYRFAKRRADAKYENRRAAKFASWDFLDAEEDPAEKTVSYPLLSSGNLPPKIVNKAPSRCPRCRIRTPRYYVEHNNGEEQYLCTSCTQREEQSCKKKYIKRRACGNEFDKGIFDINTMADLKDSDDRVALLYADINNLGGQGEKETFAEDKALHKSVEKAVIDAVHTAIKEAMKAGYKQKDGTLSAMFEIIALAGDDICLLLPGDAALLAAKTIVDIFDAKVEEFGLELTISVSACVAKDTTAITYMERIVGDALDNAKEYAREKKQSVVNLSFFEQPSGLFPMTTDEINDFASLLSDVSGKDSPVAVTAMRNIAAARRELVFDEEFDELFNNSNNKEFTEAFELYCNYYLSRDVQSIRKSRSTLERIRAKYEGKNPWPDFVIWRNPKARQGGD
jgi:hypothetical protein